MKKTFRGNHTIYPERNNIRKPSDAADVPDDYGSLLVIFDRAFSIAVRSAG